MPFRHLAYTLLLVLTCLLPASFAHATPIAAGTYTLTGVTVGGYALTGSVTLDAAGLATSASLMWANSAYSNPVFSTINSKGVSGYNPIANFAYIAQGNGQVALYYLQTLNAAGGITLCEAGTNCAQDSYLQMYYLNYNSKLVGGSLVAGTGSSAVTPEPSGAVLMATGLFVAFSVFFLSRRQRPAVIAA